MTQTTTDYLLQVAAPVTDRAYSASSANDGGRFNDHLSQASTLTGDDSRNNGKDSLRSDSAHYDGDERSWNTSPPEASSHDSGNSTSIPTPLSKQDESVTAASGAKASVADTGRDEHDTKKSDDNAAAEAAGAGQVACDHSQKSDAKVVEKTNSKSTAVPKTELVEKAVTQASDRKVATTAATQTTNNAAAPDSAAQYADEAAKLGVTTSANSGAANEDNERTQETGSEGKQSKAANKGASTAKSKAGTNGTEEKGTTNELAENGEKSLDVAQKVTDHAQMSTTEANPAAAKGQSDSDESIDDESRSGSRSDSRAGVRADASHQANKVDTAQLVAAAANPTDAGSNAPSKSENSKQSTKPITAKSETAAAAFARMTRTNNTSSNDSTTSANDLPQIDPSRFIGRVAKAFQTAQDRGGTLQLRLSPPELGALRIELNVKDGVMSASLQTENANARRLLLDHLPALRDRLAEQNIRVDRFDVDVRQDGPGGQTDARGSQQQQFQHQPDRPAPRRQAQPQPRETAVPERTAIAPSVSDTGLNLIV
jgi:flagellar hook-length control protein FliK